MNSENGSTTGVTVTNRSVMGAALFGHTQPVPAMLVTGATVQCALVVYDALAVVVSLPTSLSTLISAGMMEPVLSRKG